MDFLEAVRALQAGECEGISRISCAEVLIRDTSGLTDYIAIKDFHQSWALCRINSILATDWQLVNPKPRTETREVKVYIGIAPDGFHKEFFGSNPPEVMNDGHQLVELTGTYTVETPRKERKRVEVGGIEIDKDGDAREASCDKYGALFKSHPECLGKTGTLTFEWEE